jgi:hypothetical protein
MYSGGAGPLPAFLLRAAVALVAAGALASVSVAVENAAQQGYQFLERLGLIRRLCPEVDVSDA